MVRKSDALTKKLLIIAASVIFLLTSVYLLTLYRSNIASETCIDPEVGISLTVPKGWTCHLSEQDGFYLEPSWVETVPDTGSSPQFTIWFKKKPDYSQLKIDSRFCNINEYSPQNSECLESVYYSHNDFQIKELVNQKKPEYGVSKTYLGFYKDFLQVEFNPSSTDFELRNEDRKHLDSIFDSIKRI